MVTVSQQQQALKYALRCTAIVFSVLVMVRNVWKGLIKDKSCEDNFFFKILPVYYSEKPNKAQMGHIYKNENGYKSYT